MKKLLRQLFKSIPNLFFFLFTASIFLASPHTYASATKIEKSEPFVNDSREFFDTENIVGNLAYEDLHENHRLEQAWRIISPKMTILIYLDTHLPGNSAAGYTIIRTEKPSKELESLGHWHIIECKTKTPPVFFLESHQNIYNDKEYVCDLFADGSPCTYGGFLATKEQTKSKLNALEQPQKVNLLETKDLIPTLMESDTIIFFEGSGLSAKKVWALPQFHKQFGLEDIPSTYSVTEESMSKFVPLFIKNPENYYPVMTSFFSTLALSYSSPSQKPKTESTKAHYALKEIVDTLKEKGKQVVVHSGNFDGFLYKAGLEVACSDDGYLLDKSKTNSLTIVLLGLRNDHDHILLRYKNTFPDTKIFSFNLEPVKIVMRNDSTCLAESMVDFAGHILGDLQETLPDLKEQLLLENY